jgi:hypothetical protein
MLTQKRECIAISGGAFVRKRKSIVSVVFASFMQKKCIYITAECGEREKDHFCSGDTAGSDSTQS